MLKFKEENDKVAMVDFHSKLAVMGLEKRTSHFVNILLS